MSAVSESERIASNKTKKALAKVGAFLFFVGLRFAQAGVYRFAA